MNKIDEALDILHKRGWMKGDYNNSQGNVCIRGAFRLCMQANDYELDEYRFVVDAINKLFPNKTGPVQIWLPLRVADFNDSAETTFEDVVLVLKHASEELDRSMEK